MQEERDKLKRELASVNASGATASDELKAKEQHIAELSAEGERLSAQIGQLEASSRKVRKELKAATADAEERQKRVRDLESELEDMRAAAQASGQSTEARVKAAEAEVWHCTLLALRSVFPRVPCGKAV